MRRLAALTAASCCISAACATAPPAPAPSSTISVTANVPTFAALAETKESQEKGGVEISVAPMVYEVVQRSRSRDIDRNPSFLEALAGPENWRQRGMRFVDRITEPVLIVTPGELRFRISINNKLPRVFRGSGTVVQFNVGGKLTAVDQRGYADLVNAIIPPRTEQQVEVYGPSLGSLPDQTTVALFLYDVVTATDTAGNVTAKQNFEWYFNYAIQVRRETLPVTRERLWIEPGEFRGRGGRGGRGGGAR